MFQGRILLLGQFAGRLGIKVAVFRIQFKPSKSPGSVEGSTGGSVGVAGFGFVVDDGSLFEVGIDCNLDVVPMIYGNTTRIPIWCHL